MRALAQAWICPRPVYPRSGDVPAQAGRQDRDAADPPCRRRCGPAARAPARALRRWECRLARRSGASWESGRRDAVGRSKKPTSNCSAATLASSVPPGTGYTPSGGPPGCAFACSHRHACSIHHPSILSPARDGALSPRVSGAAHGGRRSHDRCGHRSLPQALHGAAGDARADRARSQRVVHRRDRGRESCRGPALHRSGHRAQPAFAAGGEACGRCRGDGRRPRDAR